MGGDLNTLYGVAKTGVAAGEAPDVAAKDENLPGLPRRLYGERRHEIAGGHHPKVCSPELFFDLNAADDAPCNAAKGSHGEATACASSV